VPEELAEVDYKGEKLSFVDKIKYSDALNAEYLGTKGDADEKEVPNATIHIGEIDANSVGEFTAFWHMVAFYSSILRDVNPFDQPAVERSKNITMDIIKRIK
jgi:glucose-6-phosphate isomerase